MQACEEYSLPPHSRFVQNHVIVLPNDWPPFIT